jgi:predicted N-acetyltransferase YhbS
LPEFQNHGVGKLIMEALLEKLPNSAPVLIFVAPGQQNFYRKFGFENLKKRCQSRGTSVFP